MSLFTGRLFAEIAKTMTNINDKMILNIYSGMELVSALAEYALVSLQHGDTEMISFEGVDNTIVLAAIEDAKLYCSETVPDENDYDNVSRWLNAIETLALTEFAASILHQYTWATKLSASLKQLLAVRVTAIENKDELWRFGALADEKRNKGLGSFVPWNKIENFFAADRTEITPKIYDIIVESWIRKELSAFDAEELKKRIVDIAPLRKLYKDTLLDHNEKISILTVPANLRTQPSVSIPIPHVGRDANFEVYIAENGLSLNFPGIDSITKNWSELGFIEYIVNDAIIGDCIFKFQKIESDLFSDTSEAVSKLTEIETDPDYPADKAILAANAAIGLLENPKGWFGCLVEIAKKFNNEEIVEQDELIFVERALQVRASLDAIFYRYLDPKLHTLLNKLDICLAEVKDAVLAVGEERYYSILEFAEPEPGTWWAARMDLDRDVPDELLSEAIKTYVEADSQSVPNKLSVLVQNVWDKIRTEIQDRKPLPAYSLLSDLLPSPSVFPIGLGIMAAATVVPKIKNPLHYRSMDENWSAVVSYVPRDKTVSVRVAQNDTVIPSDTKIWLRGIVAELLPKDDPHRALFDLESIAKMQNENGPELAVILPDNTVIIMLHD